MSKHMTDEQAAGAMPDGNMASLSGQPGAEVEAMPAGAMESEAATASTGMPGGRPGELGEMPSNSPAETVDSLDEMPAPAMAEGQPGTEGDMPSGAMEAAPKLSDAAPSATPIEAPVLEITGTWQLAMRVSQITRG
ncbi:MAG TPA: hypothetical protein VL334_21885 [Anaerolineae bacterium]|nr:hypothetical protein [Anaerolineae bacterium]